jgi:hypothetical protein
MLAASVIAPSAVASLLACPTAAHAEPMRLAQAVEYGGLPPYEIITIVRSAGLDPIDRPVRRGPHYVLHAIGQNDQEVRVIVDARRGEIVRIVPTMSASRMPPGPGGGGVTMGPYERMDGYGPRGAAPGYVAPEGYRYGGRPAAPEDDEEDTAYDDNANAPRPPGNVPGKGPGNVPGSAPRPGYAPAPRTGYADPPPVIRAAPPSGNGVARGTDLPPPSGASAPPPYAPRAATAYPPTRSTGLPPSGDPRLADPRLANVPPPAAGRDGLLPPPPERFPQRAAPAAEKKELKPVKRAAATAAPKIAPVPKPKPAPTPASASTPAAAPPATPATPAPEVAKEPAKETAKPAEQPAAPPIADTKPAPEANPSTGQPAHEALPN